MNKVLGPVEGSDLGFTMSHEHVLLGAAGMVNQMLVSERGTDPALLSIYGFGQPTAITRQQVDGFLNAGAIRVSAWPAHCETAEEMGEQLERMAEALVR